MAQDGGQVNETASVRTIIIINIIESYIEYNEKKLKNTKTQQKCIKHTHIDKSIQLTIVTT